MFDFVILVEIYPFVIFMYGVDFAMSTERRKILNIILFSKDGKETF